MLKNSTNTSVLQDLIQLQNLNNHKNKLKNIKGMVDNTIPKTFNIQLTGGKKNQINMMKKYDDQNENLSLISKIEKIDNRKNMSVSRLKQPVQYKQILSSPFNENPFQHNKNPSKIVNIHSFTDYQVAEINNNNRLMASKLEKAESDIKHLTNGHKDGNKQEYLCKQISKHNTKSTLLKKMMSLTKSASDVFSIQPSIDNDMLQQIKISDHNKVKIQEEMEDELMGGDQGLEKSGDRDRDREEGIREADGDFNDQKGKLRNENGGEVRGVRGEGRNEGKQLLKEDEKKFMEYKQILNKNKMLAKYMKGKLDWSSENKNEITKENDANLNTNRINKNSQIDSTNIFYKKIHNSSINVSSYNDLLIQEGQKNLLTKNYPGFSTKSPLKLNNSHNHPSLNIPSTHSPHQQNSKSPSALKPIDKHHNSTLQTSDSTTYNNTRDRSEVSLGNLHNNNSEFTLQEKGTAGFNMTMTDLSQVGGSKTDLKDSDSSEVNIIANQSVENLKNRSDEKVEIEQEVDIRINNRQDYDVSENVVNDFPSFREE